MTFLNALSEVYFRPKAFELGGRLYEWMGVVPFKNFMVRVGRSDRRTNNSPSRYFLPRRTLKGIVEFEKKTRRDELIHLVALLPSALGLAVGGLGSWRVTVVLVLVFALNFHPFILQRYNRIRIRSVLARKPLPGSRE
jgi:hypothetical protein